MVYILLYMYASSLLEKMMLKNRLLGIGLLFLITVFIFIQPAYIGPGSKTAKAFDCGKKAEQRSLQDLG